MPVVDSVRELDASIARQVAFPAGTTHGGVAIATQGGPVTVATARIGLRDRARSLAIGWSRVDKKGLNRGIPAMRQRESTAGLQSPLTSIHRNQTERSDVLNE